MVRAVFVFGVGHGNGGDRRTARIVRMLFGSAMKSRRGDEVILLSLGVGVVLPLGLSVSLRGDRDG